MLSSDRPEPAAPRPIHRAIQVSWSQSKNRTNLGGKQTAKIISRQDRISEGKPVLEVDFVAHDFVPPGEVILVPRESVDEEIVLLGRGHRVLQEFARDLDGNDAPVLDVGLDQFPELRVGVRPLGTEEIA